MTTNSAQRLCSTRSNASRRHWLLPILLMVVGCVSNWRTAPAAPVQVVREQGPTEMRVKRTDGTYVVLRDPAAVGDSLVGWEAPPWDKAGGLTRRAIALADVREVAVKGNDPAANIFLGVAAGLGALTVLLCVATCGQGFE